METPSRNLSWSPLLVNFQLILMHIDIGPLGTNEPVEVQYHGKIKEMKRIASNQ